MNKRLKKKKGKIREIELWNLDLTIAKFIYPRIKAFRKMKRHIYCCDDGITKEEWEDILLKIEVTFQFIVEHRFDILKKEEVAKLEEGMDLFRKYYFNLWD